MYDHERSLVQEYEGRPFVLIGVNSDDPSELANIERQRNLIWRSFAAGQGGGKIAKDWKVSSWPTIYLIDEQGVIRYMNKRGAQLEAAIAELVAKAEANQRPGS
jgi:hypothetical protein